MNCINQDLKEKTLQLLSEIESGIDWSSVDSLENQNDKMFEGCMLFCDRAKEYFVDLRSLRQGLIQNPTTAINLVSYALPFVERFLVRTSDDHSSAIQMAIQKRLFAFQATLFLNRWLLVDRMDDNQIMQEIQNMLWQYAKILAYINLNDHPVNGENGLSNPFA